MRKPEALIAGLVCLLMQTGVRAATVNLSPDQWPAEARVAAEKLETLTSYPTASRTVQGASGVVVSTMSPIAALAGVETLKAGGTAADAAAATALTQVTTSLGTLISFAGILEGVYFDAKTHRVYTLNAGWDSWRGEMEPTTIPSSAAGVYAQFASPDAAKSGALGRTVLVPGFMAGIEALQTRFGHLKFSQVLAPAIGYAQNGITVSRTLGYFASTNGPTLTHTDAGKRFLLQAGSDLPKMGDRFVQTDLANTLRAVAANGAREMYSGKWARDFVNAVVAAGGKASMEDLQRYRVQWGEAATSSINGTGIALSASSMGAQQVREALTLIEAANLTKQPSYSQSPQSLLTLSRILTWVTLVANVPAVTESLRAQGIDASPAQRLTSTYAKAVLPILASLYLPPPPPASNHSAAIVVVDRWGNVAALVHTSNTLAWGTNGIVVGGVAIPDAAGIYQQRLAAVKPGDRLPNELCPLIAFHDGKPVLGMATIGSSLIHETVRVLLGIADGGDLPTVMAAPPLLLALSRPPAPGKQRELPLSLPADAYAPDFVAHLHSLGAQVEEQGKNEVRSFKGTAAAAQIAWPGPERRAAEVPGNAVFAASY